MPTDGFLARLIARVEAEKQPLDIITVHLPPYVPTAFDATLEEITAAPERWGVSVDSYPYEDDLSRAIESAYIKEINTTQSTEGRVRLALEHLSAYEPAVELRTQPCPACIEAARGTFTWHYPARQLRGRCSAACAPQAIAAAITALVVSDERQAQLEAQNEAASAAIAKTSLTAALGGTLPQAWLIPGFIASDALTLLCGASGDGKTWLSMWSAICVSQGIPWLTRPVTRARTMLVLLEGSRRDRYRRLAQLAKGLGTTFEALEKDLFIYPGELKTDDPASFAELATAVRDTGSRFVVIDNLTEARHDADENSAARLGAALRPLAELAHRSEIAVLLLHHSNIKGEIRGSTAIRQHADVVFSITKRSPANNAPQKLRCRKDRLGDALDDVIYRLRDERDLVTGAVVAVVPALEGSPDTPIVPLPQAMELRISRLLGCLPATSEELYTKMPGSRTTIKKLRTKLELEHIIAKDGDNWVDARPEIVRRKIIL